MRHISFFTRSFMNFSEKISFTRFLLLLLPIAIAAGCSTGVESVRHITDRDVERHFEATRAAAPSLAPFVDSLRRWRPGKRFYVTDHQARLLFENSADYSLDTLRLGGTVVTFTGFDHATTLDNRRVVRIILRDASGHRLVYNTGKELEALTPDFDIPLLIDLDMVEHYARLLEGKTFYILSRQWYHPHNEQPIAGRKYVAVTIDSVLPGNKVVPLRLMFTDVGTRRKAMILLSAGDDAMKTRTFDALFSANDPRRQHRNITDDTWRMIVDGKVKDGMTKDECRLSLGEPRNIRRAPDQEGMHEFWIFDNGSTLRFDDGVLNLIRN